MDEETIYRIIPRHDTSTNWTLNNPVLAYGEYGIEDDTRRIKRGDGTTDWINLKYDTLGIEDVVIELVQDTFVKKESGKGLSENDFTNEYRYKLDELHNYDDTQIKTMIGNNTRNIQTVAETVNNHTEQIQQNTLDINSQGQLIEGITNNVVEIEEDLDTAVQDINTNKENIETNTSDINQAKEDIQELQEQIVEAGKVDTVNGIQPDGNKNINITGSDIPYMSGEQEPGVPYPSIDSQMSNISSTLYSVEMSLRGELSEERTARQEADENLQDQIDNIHIPEYTIVKQQEAEQGYAHTYYLTKDNIQVGAKINIPKDLVVENATLETVVEEDVPYEGARIGDKYIDIIIANKQANHIYIPVNDLVDVYTGSEGAQIIVSVDDHNVISATIKTHSITNTLLDSSLNTDISVAKIGVLGSNITPYIIGNNKGISFSSRYKDGSGYVVYGSQNIVTEGGDTLVSDAQASGALGGVLLTLTTNAEAVNFDNTGTNLQSTKLAQAIRELDSIISDLHTSNLVNDGDGNSPYATEEYVGTEVGNVQNNLETVIGDVDNISEQVQYMQQDISDLQNRLDNLIDAEEVQY